MAKSNCFRVIVFMVGFSLMVRAGEGLSAECGDPVCEAGECRQTLYIVDKLPDQICGGEKKVYHTLIVETTIRPIKTDQQDWIQTGKRIRVTGWGELPGKIQRDAGGVSGSAEKVTVYYLGFEVGISCEAFKIRIDPASTPRSSPELAHSGAKYFLHKMLRKIDALYSEKTLDPVEWEGNY